LGLYRAAGESQLQSWLDALPFSAWMNVTIMPLEGHPNDPAAGPPSRSRDERVAARLPEPRLTLVYRLETALGQPLDLGQTPQGRRRIVALTGGRFSGPELSGKLLPDASADWQIVLPDGTAVADVRYTLQTDHGALLYGRTQGVRHGPPEVLARLGRGEDVDAGGYTFRT
jgi:hypothetical protein